MPIFPLAILLLCLAGSLVLINDFIFIPLHLTQGLSLPRWLGLGLLLLVFSWLFGE